jgi:hypothetical protein
VEDCCSERVAKVPVASLLPAQPSPDDGNALNLRANHLKKKDPPLAWHDDAFVADHCRTAEPPALTDVGVAVNVSVGGVGVTVGVGGVGVTVGVDGVGVTVGVEAVGWFATVTVTDWVEVPPLPEHANV